MQAEYIYPWKVEKGPDHLECSSFIRWYIARSMDSKSLIFCK